MKYHGAREGYDPKKLPGFLNVNIDNYEANTNADGSKESRKAKYDRRKKKRRSRKHGRPV